MNSIAGNPPLCEACLFENIVAFRGGPTCKHVQPSGAQWWPANWDKMQEAERLAFIAQRKQEQQST